MELSIEEKPQNRQDLSKDLTGGEIVNSVANWMKKVHDRGKSR